MPKLVVAHRDFLSALAKSNNKQRKAFLLHANKPLIDAISECCFNTLAGNLKLSPAQKRKLLKHKKSLRLVGSKRLAWRKRKSILVQKGHGILAFLIPTVLSALSGILGRS